MTSPSPQESWQPPANVTTHGGQLIPTGREFFCPPPPEIGPVVSAWSDVRAGQNLWPVWLKLALTVGTTAAAIGVVVPLLLSRASSTLPSEAPYVASIMVGLVPLSIGLARSFRARRCSYIGEEGMAMFCTRGSRKCAKAQVVRFADIADTSYTQKHYRRRGTDTYEFQYRCIGHNGSVIFHVRGKCILFHGQALPNSPYPFVRAANGRWEQIRNAQSGGPSPAEQPQTTA